MGGIGATYWLRIAKIILLRYPRWPPRLPYWKSSIVICSRTVSQIERKLGGKHRGNMEIQNWWSCSVPVSKLATMAAILKKKTSKPHLLPNGKSDWAESWWEALGRYGDSALLKSFRPDIHDGRHGSYLDFFKRHFPNSKWSYVETSWEAWGITEIQNSYYRSVSISRATVLKFFKPLLLPNRRSDWAEPWWEALGWHADSELQKSSRSNIQYGRGETLETLSDSESLKAIWSDDTMAQCNNSWSA